MTRVGAAFRNGGATSAGPRPSPARGLSSGDAALEAARREVRERTRLQHPRGEADLGALLPLAAYVTACPMAVVSLLKGNEDWIKARVGLSAEDAVQLTPFCAAVRGHDGGIFMVPDLRTDIRFLPMPGEMPVAGVRFAAGVPLTTDEGAVRGSLCVFDREARTFTPVQQDAFVKIAHEVMRCFRWDRLIADMEYALAERRQAETALRDSVERFRSVVQSAVEGIVLADEQGRVISWNRAAERMFGYQPEEILGESLAKLMPERYRPAHQAGMARLQRGGQPKQLGKTLDVAGLRKDGTEFPIELSIARGTGERGVFYTGIIRDVTERKETEAERERLIRELQDALAKVKTLGGLLPICATCKKIRDDKGYWNGLETYLAAHAEVEFSHGLCPECARKMHPDWDEFTKNAPPPPRAN